MLAPSAPGDNGPEFSDPEAIENYRPGPVHNSTKTLPRGVRVSCCDLHFTPSFPSSRAHFSTDVPFSSMSVRMILPPRTR